MKSLVLLCILMLAVRSVQTQLKLPVRPDTQQKLSLSLSRLTEELEYFRTPYQNRTNLYKRVALTEQYLTELQEQLRQYNNVIQGQQNAIDGNKNIIVGSYNTLRGSNNFVFIEKYTGQANGDLLIGRWRIEIQKKKLILVNSSFAISFINQELNRRYLRFLTGTRTFSYGSSNGQHVVTVIKQESDPFSSSFSFGSTFEDGQNFNGNVQSQRTTQQQNSFVRPQQPSGNFQQNSGRISFGASGPQNSQSNQQANLQNNGMVQSLASGQVVQTSNFVDQTSFSSNGQLNQNLSLQSSRNQQISARPLQGTTMGTFNTDVPSTGYVNSNFNANRLRIGQGSSGNLRSQLQPVQADPRQQIVNSIRNTVSSRYFKPQTVTTTMQTSNLFQPSRNTNSFIPPSSGQPTGFVNMASWRNRF